ncbi:MAG: hypothetical protein WCD79_17205 [Chthoniobacteraceae bacterium]
MIRSSRLAMITALALALVPVLPPNASAATDDEVAAHKIALDLAGAFSNDGFKLRDGNWAGPIRPKESIFVQVNLYAGNQYWFCTGATEKAKKVLVTVYDEAGQLVQSEAYQDGTKAAAGYSPTASGAYIIRIQETEGDPATVCLTYSYK